MTTREEAPPGARGTRFLELQQTMANRWIDFIGQATRRMMSGRLDPAGWTRSYYDLVRGLTDDAGRMAEIVWGPGEPDEEEPGGESPPRSTRPRRG